MMIITQSERYNLLKEAHQKRKAQKLEMIDLAKDVEEQDEVGVTEDESI